MTRALRLARCAAAGLLGLLLTWGPAVAQQLVLPGDALSYSTAAVTVGNTTTATNLFSVSIPGFLVAPQKTTITGATSVHVVALGTITTVQGSPGAVGSANLGCNYGGSTATLALINGQTPSDNLISTPIVLDLWLRSTGAATEMLQGNLHVGSMMPYGAVVSGTTSTSAPQTLLCTWQWQTSNASNTITITSTAVVVGD